MQAGGRADTLQSENGRTEFEKVEIARIGLRRSLRVQAPRWHMAILSISRIGATLDESNWRFRRLPPAPHVVTVLIPWTRDDKSTAQREEGSSFGLVMLLFSIGRT